MFEETTNIINVKYSVLYQVAKVAFDGGDDEDYEKIPQQLIPGPKATFRCCIYKEREIIRQRVRLARGKSSSADRKTENVVQVISSACEECPITRYTVTDNCQRCMSKKCQASCNFGAISMHVDRAYIDPSKCKECGKCAKACPYNAIANLMRPCKKTCPVGAIQVGDYGIVEIDETKCISCGSCVNDCPFGAISEKSYIVDAINMIKSDKPVYALVAPAVEGQFGADVTVAQLAKAIEQLGFDGMFEVSLGGDLTAASEADEWAEAYKEGKKLTTSCCPAFVNMIKKHFPMLLDNVSTTVSPMTGLARLVRKMHPDANLVFIGPCIAKKMEVNQSVRQDSADIALTFEELSAMFAAKGISPAGIKAEDTQEGSIYGKRFSQSGGVTAAVLECLKETNQNTDIKVRKCNGAAECKTALMMLKVNKLPEDFIEGMSCIGGCMNGPGGTYNVNLVKDREALLKKADGRGVHENLDKFKDYDFSMHLYKEK